MTLKRLPPRLLLAGILGALLVLPGLIAVAPGQADGVWRRIAEYLAPRPAVGGEFTLTATDGRPVAHADLLGRPAAILFGYTACPDICPTTLYEAGGWLRALGPDAAGIGVYFITVDPAADTVEHLAGYMTAFDPRIVALTGSRQAVGQALRAYGVTAEPTAGTDPADNLITHTASVYLQDRRGRFVDTIRYGESDEQALAKIRRLLRL